MYRAIFENGTGTITRYPIPDYPYDLIWHEELEIGFLKSDGYDYGEEYWSKYQSYKNSLGEKLTNGRQKFVNKNYKIPSNVCDVGIGSGEFVDAFNCYGYDVNPFAIEWLKENKRYADVYVDDFQALCFWDSLEHIEDPSPLFNTNHLFISMPIHKDVEACLVSKHLRPGEHIWHFTRNGIKNLMLCYDYKLKDESDFESKLGREDILSYYFKKSNK